MSENGCCMVNVIAMIKISASSGIYTLTASQFLPITLDEAWHYFSSPKNLANITPKAMGFTITNGEPDEMHEGQIISYLIAVFPKVKTSWVTEITHVKPKVYFVDEQRFGPYAMWHHEHFFEVKENGVLVSDRVSYKLPLGLLGRIFGSSLVKRKLYEIFLYRQKILDEKFKSLI